jgi:hypothetical protein
MVCRAQGMVPRRNCTGTELARAGVPNPESRFLSCLVYLPAMYHTDTTANAGGLSYPRLCTKNDMLTVTGPGGGDS